MNRRSLDSSCHPASSTGHPHGRKRSKSLVTPQSGGLSSISLAQQPKQEQHNDPLPSTVLRKIPRPPNAFILYRSDKMRELARQETQPRFDTGLSKLDYQRQLSKRIGELWRNETQEVKAAFYDKASQAAHEHALRYPDYRYNPSTRKASVSKRSESSTSVSSPGVDRTLEVKADTDFTPGDLSGPVSGFGSGSGRRRASLDGARAKNAPYPQSRARTASSSDSSSPAADRQTRQQNAVPIPVAPDRVPLVRSVSQATTRPSGRLEPERTINFSARRSFEGHLSRALASHESFNTLLPQHLREQTRVFLAPIGPPPVPVGQAITTDDATTTTEAQAQAQSQQQHRSWPKVNLAEAVKRALPPERRALLHASLAKKGLLPAVEAVTPAQTLHTPAPNERKSSVSTPSHYTPEETTPPLVQDEFWNPLTSCAGENDSHKVWVNQQAPVVGGTDPQGSSCYDLDSCWQYVIDPLLQASHSCLPVQSETGPNVNVVMGATDAAKYSGLADWMQPNPCWLDRSVEQTSASLSTDPSEVTFPSDTGPSYLYNEQVANQSALQQGATKQQDANTNMTGPRSCFSEFETIQYGPLDYDINATNSAVVALSDPNEMGQVLGHFYSLTGEPIGQGTVSANADQTSDGNVEETARQNRAVLELLQQMMESNTETSRGVQPLSSRSQNTPLPSLDNDTAFRPPIVPSQQQVYHQDPSQPDWQGWPLGLQSSSYANIDLSNSRPPAYVVASQEQPDSTTYSDAKGCAPAACFADAGLSTATGYPICQGRTAYRSHATSPTNFSRPMAEHSGYTPASNADTHSTFQEKSVLEAEGYVTTQQEQVQEKRDNDARSAANKGLRSWKASQLNSIKGKLARIKTRASPSASSLSASPHNPAGTDIEQVPS